MQTDRRLVQHVEDAAQIRAELRREADALRLAAAECLRGTVQREVIEPDIAHEVQALVESPAECPPRSSSAAAELQLRSPRRRRSPAESATISSIV